MVWCTNKFSILSEVNNVWIGILQTIVDVSFAKGARQQASTTRVNSAEWKAKSFRF